MEDFRVNDLVRIRGPANSTIGRVMGIRTLAGPSAWVSWEAGMTLQLFSELERICRNCYRKHALHGKDGKCLFGASTWG